MKITVTILQICHTTTSLSRAVQEAYLTGKPIPSHLHQQFEDVARSAYRVTNYLAKNSQYPVMLENSNQQVTEQDKKTVTSVFPQGLPQNYNQLSLEQKYILVVYGGPPTAASLEMIPTIHSDHTSVIDNPDQFAKKFGIKSVYSDNFFSPQGKADLAKSGQGREFLTLARAQCVAKETGSNHVIVVYGENHPFKDVAKCFPDIILNIKKFHQTDDGTPAGKMLFEHQQEYLKYRNQADCEKIESTLATPPVISYACQSSPSLTPPIGPNMIKNDAVSPSVPTNNMHFNPYLGVGMVGVIAVFGYWCCSKAKAASKAPSHEKAIQKKIN